MSLPENQNVRYTYKDYLTWPDEEKYQLIDGVPYMQSAPSRQHQSILREIFTQFNNYLRNIQCKVFSAPFDLRLPDADEKNDELTHFFPLFGEKEGKGLVREGEII